MATRNIVPRADGEGTIGTVLKKWLGGWITTLVSSVIKPASDSTTAVQIQESDGTPVVNVDTTNGRVGIGTTGPSNNIHIEFDDSTVYEDLYQFKGMFI